MNDAAAGPPPATVIILAAAAGHACALGALDPMLGARGRRCLQRVLVARATRWAADAAPGRAVLGYWPLSAGDEMRALAGPQLSVWGLAGSTPSERTARACARAGDLGSGPVLLVDCALPTLRAAHAHAAFQDMTAGCQVSYGPATGGGWYLAAASRPDPSLLGLGRERPDSDLLTAGLHAAQQHGLRLGLLRSERTLESPSAVRALLADPLCPGEVRAVLSEAQDTRESTW